MSDVGFHFIIACPTHFGYFVLIVGKDWDKHGGGTNGHPWV